MGFFCVRIICWRTRPHKHLRCRMLSWPLVSHLNMQHTAQATVMCWLSSVRVCATLALYDPSWLRDAPPCSCSSCSHHHHVAYSAIASLPLALRPTKVEERGACWHSVHIAAAAKSLRAHTDCCACCCCRSAGFRVMAAHKRLQPYREVHNSLMPSTSPIKPQHGWHGPCTPPERQEAKNFTLGEDGVGPAVSKGLGVRCMWSTWALCTFYYASCCD
jgi:hypothetical protein